MNPSKVDKTVCDEYQLIKHPLYFILKKSVFKTDLYFHLEVRSIPSNLIFANPVNLQNMSTLGVGQFPSRTLNEFFLN